MISSAKLNQAYNFAKFSIELLEEDLNLLFRYKKYYEFLEYLSIQFHISLTI